MRDSFHRVCFPCPERLPTPCSTASDELINIIKANLPHHFLPAKAGSLRRIASSRVGQVAADIGRRIRHGASKLSGKRREDERKGKREKKSEKDSHFIPWAHRSAIRLSSALSVALERWRSMGVHAQSRHSGTMITSLWSWWDLLWLQWVLPGSPPGD